MDREPLHRVVTHLFARGTHRSTRVGVEQELLVFDAAGRTVPLALLRPAVRSAVGTGAPYVGFEPGGQLEVNLPPSASPVAAAQALRDRVTGLRDGLAAHDIRLSAQPVDLRPESEVPLRLRSPRYLRMQRHFDTVGPAGRLMMRRTAGTQICLDWWPGRAGAEQWRALTLSAPFLAAAFARGTGPGSRLATWLAVDPARTAFDGRLLHGDDPVSAYAGFAAAATCFVDGGPSDHLSTLFPPVRPRGRYLEVRYFDVQEDVEVVASTLAAIAYDADRRRRVLRRLEPLADRLGELWEAAAAGELLSHAPLEAAA